MNWIILPKYKNIPYQPPLLRAVLNDEFLRAITWHGMQKSMGWTGTNGHWNLALSDSRTLNDNKADDTFFSYSDHITLNTKNGRTNPWVVIRQGRYVTNVDGKWFHSILQDIEAEVVCIQVTPDLKAYREKVQLTSEHQIGGFRRIYADTARDIALPSEWPHLVLIRRGSLSQSKLPLVFSEFINQCVIAQLRVRSLNIAGEILDLETENDLLIFLLEAMNSLPPKYQDYLLPGSRGITATRTEGITEQTRCFGNILAAESVGIESGAILIGPAILADNVKVKSGAVVQSSIITSGVTIKKDTVLQNRIVLNANHKVKKPSHPEGKPYVSLGRNFSSSGEEDSRYKIWSFFSYAGCGKRFVDILFALTILLLFAPVVPFLALAIKLTSAGPVLYKSRRQGRYGKEFHCLKFRTMITGADKVQDRLRNINQVDGPQFKIEEDPRLTLIGKFFRDTYLDEIPQFLNVLRGQMSVIGPRPSPEPENSLCAYWRDARLSVRPGITGLWQVCRTRMEGEDFQEWIHYDTQYVRKLSLKLDLQIAWRTFVKILKSFARQF